MLDPPAAADPGAAAADDLARARPAAVPGEAAADDLLRARTAVDAFWHRLLLPLRPRSWRYATVAILLGAALLAAPWHRLRYPVGVRAEAAPAGWRTAPHDWLALAHAIEAPVDLRPFEPVLEEVTGAPPLTYHRVRFHPEPRGSAGEVASYSGRRIDLYGPAPYDRRDHTYTCDDVTVCGDVSLCRDAPGPAGTDWIRGRNVAHWVHEQGHFYEDFPRGAGDAEHQWIGETAAAALVLAFAEHLGRHYGPDLAAHLVLAQLVPVEGTTRFALAPTTRRDLVRALDDLPTDDAALERLAAAAALILRASGLPSFGAVWRFVHHRPAAEVAARVRRYAARLPAGYDLALDLALELRGAHPPRRSRAALPPVADAATLGPLRDLTRGACLELHYERTVVSFCGDRRAARIDLAAVVAGAPPRLSARMARGERDLCLVTLDSAARPRAAFVYEDGVPALRAAAAMSAPCACRAATTPLPGRAGARALGTTTAALQAVIQQALADLAGAGSPLERAYAAEVVAGVAAAWPPGPAAPPPPRPTRRRPRHPPRD